MLFKDKKHHKSYSEIASKAVSFADIYNFSDPENTTFRLRHAANYHTDLEADLNTVNMYSEVLFRQPFLSSNLRKKTMLGHEYQSWLHNNLETIGSVKNLLKRSLRRPWKNHYDWLGQSIQHSDALKDSRVRRSYEQLAIAYRIQEHLLNLSSGESTKTNKSGYQIEQALRTKQRIIAKAERLIDHYYSPEIHS